MKSVSLKMVLFLAAFTMARQNGLAQNTDSLKAQIVKDWQRAKAYTKTYLSIMPAEKYGFTPVDTARVRTFAGQMQHLAQGNIFLISAATGKQINFSYPNVNKLPPTQVKDSITYCVLASYDFCINALKDLGVSKYGEKVINAGHTESRFEWIMVGYEHQTHQRALCTMYLRLAGIRPPDQMLF
jgi:hypothetical protein